MVYWGDTRVVNRGNRSITGIAGVTIWLVRVPIIGFEVQFRV